MCLHGARPNVPSRVSPIDWTIRCTPYLRDAAHTGSGMCVTGMFGVYSQRTLKHFHMLVGRDGGGGGGTSSAAAAPAAVLTDCLKWRNVRSFDETCGSTYCILKETTEVGRGRGGG